MTHRHGTWQRYSMGKCKCSRCRRAWAEYCQVNRRRAGVRPQAEVNAEKRAGIKHGTAGGYNRLRCSCEECRRWAREKRAGQRARARARA